MINYLVIDVDGTLTDGGIYYDGFGNEFKKFCVKDGTGIICGKRAGIKIMVLTGRECVATSRRMQELNIDYIVQGVKDKADYLKKWMINNCIERDEIGYIGDDVNDLASMLLCGFVSCPADACMEVKKISNYVSPVYGGRGVVRDVIEYYLSELGVWDIVVRDAFGDENYGLDSL